MSEQLTDLCCCPRCEGNGRLYADGGRHYPSEHAETTDCPVCDGTGKLCTACDKGVDYDVYVNTDKCPHCGLPWSFEAEGREA